MVSSCCVKGCSEKFVKGGGVSYFRISSKPEAQKIAWISALQRNGWTPKPHHRICSRHFVSGTWNADPNHIDYVPTLNMNASLLEGETGTTADYNTSTNSYLDDSKASQANTNGAILSNLVSNTSSSISSFLNAVTTVTSASAFTSQSSTHSISLPIRVPVSGLKNPVTSTPVSLSIGSKHNRKQPHSRVKNSNHHSHHQGVHHHEQHRSSGGTGGNAGYKEPLKIGTIPKLKSSHFCEHRDAHRNCCRVIRELAEENQILKAQVNVLMMEVQRLRTESLISLTQNGDLIQPPGLTTASQPAQPAQQQQTPAANGISTPEPGQLTANDIEIVSNSDSSNEEMDDMESFQAEEVTDEPAAC